LATPSTPSSNSIIGYFQPKVSIFDKRQLDYDFDILELIVDCSLSFNIVESAGFKKFAAKRDPRFTVKSATTFQGKPTAVAVKITYNNTFTHPTMLKILATKI
jgi:hypothetical protein